MDGQNLKFLEKPAQKGKSTYYKGKSTDFGNTSNSI